MGIHLDLSGFDGKTLDELKSIKAVREPSSQLLGELVEITGGDDKNMQIGATWLLRAYLEEGARARATRECLRELLPRQLREREHVREGVGS